MEKITAAYNFVPLAEQVYFPAWAKQVSQDYPLQDGICGTLDLEIDALTPLFVRGKKGAGGVLEPFKTPDGTYAIPGSSLRGMLRNVLEIATFAKFRPVNDHLYGVRDLHNQQLYVSKMARIVNERGDGPRGGAGALVPMVGAGWLRRRDGDEEFPAEIEPVSFAKIEYGYLMTLDPSFNPGRKQSGPEKYRAWRKSLEVDVHLTTAKGKDVRPRTLGEYALVDGLGGGVTGTLVFTGQPSEWSANRPAGRKGGGKPKHHDFVFYGAPGKAVKISKKVFEGFSFIHSDRGQQDRRREKPNEEWGHWKEKFENGGKAPVFYLVDEKDGGTITSFGLAMMFRLAYKRSVGELASLNQGGPAGRDATKLDLVETLFGYVASDDLRRKHKKEDLASALRGRVSIGLAAATSAKLGPEVKAVLGGPKASFYPNYVEQGIDPAQPGALPDQIGGKPRYRTYMDDGARLRGWKRYRPQDANLKPELPAKASESVMTRFRPLEAGAKFTAQIRLHNVKPEELGAILWALDFGGAKEAVHTLGMAKPLGMGRVSLRVARGRLTANKDGGAVDEAGRARCVESFVHAMEAWAKGAGVPKGWAGSVQLRELLACVKPLPPGSKEGRHLDLNHPVDRNQFTEAKKAGLALPPASGLQAKPRMNADPPRTFHGGGPGSGGPRPSDRGPGFRGPGRNAPPPKTAPAAGPRASEAAEAELLPEKTKKGGWTARLLNDPLNRKGAIQNSAEVPADKNPGDKVKLTIANINEREVQFKWPKA